MLAQLAPCVAGCLAAVAVALRVASGLTIVACVGYLDSIVYELLAGDALPMATIFRVVPYSIPATVEPYLPVATLLFAASGTALRWQALGYSSRVDPADRAPIASDTGTVGSAGQAFSCYR
jgi:hypothetical protein